MNCLKIVVNIPKTMGSKQLWNSRSRTCLEIFVLTSVKFAERAKGKWGIHTSQNNKIQAGTYFIIHAAAYRDENGYMHAFA